MRVCNQMCRGNYRSSWVTRVSYHFGAEVFLSELRGDGLLLEYDRARSGGFEPPLSSVPKGKKVHLELVRSKLPALESNDELRRRPSKRRHHNVPLEQLSVSPLCGFSSIDSNLFTLDHQITKLRLVVETPRENWV